MKNISHSDKPLRYSILAGLLIAVISLTGCGAGYSGQGLADHNQKISSVDSESGENTKSTDNEPRIKTEELDGRAYGFYVNGLLFEQFDDFYGAARYFKLAHDRDPNSQEIGLAYARTLFRLGEMEKSVNTIAALSFQDKESLVLKARVYNELGQPDSVRAAYLELIRFEKNDPRAYSMLAALYRRKNDVDSTIWAYTNLARVYTSGFQSLNEYGRQLAGAGNYEAARKAYGESVKIRRTKENVIAFLTLGELYILDNQTDSAKLLFEKGIELDPANPQLLSKMTVFHIQNDDPEEALPFALKLATLEPDDEAAVRRLGILFFALDSLQQADSIFTSLINNGDNSAINYVYRAQIAARNDNWYRARDEFRQLVKIVDSIPDGWLGLGQAYRRLGQSDKEIETYKTALKHMKNEKNAFSLYFSLGAAYERAGEIELAIETFEELLQHDPENAQTLNYLGYMLADRGLRLEYAEDLISKAITIAPDNAAYLDSYGWVRYRQGDFHAALKHLSRAVELDSDPVIFDHLGDTYNALGKSRKAQEWWKKAFEQQPDNESIKQKLNK